MCLSQMHIICTQNLKVHVIYIKTYFVLNYYRLWEMLLIYYPRTSFKIRYNNNSIIMCTHYVYINYQYNLSI